MFNDIDFKRGYALCIRDYTENGMEFIKDVAENDKAERYTEDAISKFFVLAGYYVAYEDIARGDIVL